MKELEHKLQEATGLEFRYVGEYSPVQAFAVTIYSQPFAYELVNEFNKMIHGENKVFLSEPEIYKGKDHFIYSFARWKVLLPSSAVTNEFIEKARENMFLTDQLAPMINALRERYYDVITAAANASSCQRAYERDLLQLKNEMEQDEEEKTRHLN